MSLRLALGVVFAGALVAACSSDDSVLSGDAAPDDAFVPRGGDAGGAGDAGDAGEAARDAGEAGQSYSGEATYYATGATGACGIPTPSDRMVAAMNKSQYSKSVCGTCVSVVGPKGTVKVVVIDLCPGCAAGSLDLSEQAFAKIASLSAGRVKITWSFVPC